MTLKKHIPDRLRRVLRMTGFALILRDEPALWELASVLHVRLRSPERRFLAAASLLALAPDEYQPVLDFVEGGA